MAGSTRGGYKQWQPGKSEQVATKRQEGGSGDMPTRCLRADRRHYAPIFQVCERASLQRLIAKIGTFNCPFEAVLICLNEGASAGQKSANVLL